MRSLPEGYREDAIRAVPLGKRIHSPRKRRNPLAAQRTQLVTNLEAKKNQGCGRYYDLSIQNQITKQQAKALLYYQQYGFRTVDDFSSFCESVEEAKLRRDRQLADKDCQCLTSYEGNCYSSDAYYELSQDQGSVCRLSQVRLF